MNRVPGAIRVGALAGMLAAALFVIGFALPGPPPSPDEANAAIADYLHDQRTAILAGDVLIAIAAALFVVLLAALRAYLAGEDDVLPTVTALAGVLSTGLIVAGVAVQAGLVLNSEELGDDAIRLAFDAYNALITLAGAPLAAAVAAAAVAGRAGGALPAWLAGAGLPVALLQLLTLPGVAAESGFFAAGGPMALIAFLAVSAWIVAVSAVMLRRR